MGGSAGSVGTPPFVGRIAEREALRAFAADAWAGNPRLVLVEADAGLGKSALLRRAVADLGPCHLLRASGDEAETLVPYGVVDQLVGSAPPAGAEGLELLSRSRVATDAALEPSAVGAELVRLFGNLQAVDDQPVVLVVDDLHWCDTLSAQALLFATRRLQRDRVLALVSGRPMELARLGGSWASTIGGDHRTGRIRLAGLTAAEVGELANALGVAGLSPAAAERLREHAGGSPLHCRALLEELDIEVLNQVHRDLPVPGAFAAIVLLRVSDLPEPAQRLLTAAAVLGAHPSVHLAAGVAELADVTDALDAITAADLATEEQHTGQRRLVFSHALVRRAIYDDLNPSTRRALHQRAGALTEGTTSLGHRAAAAHGPDDGLAADLARAGQDAFDRHALGASTNWWLLAADVSGDPLEREERIIEAYGAAADSGDFAQIETVGTLVAELPPSSRRSRCLGNHIFLKGRFAEAERLFRESWDLATDPADDRHAATAAGGLSVHLYLAGRSEEGVVWGERALSRIGDDPVITHIRNFVALNLVSVGRAAEAVASFELPEEPPEMTVRVTQRRVFRGITRLFADDLDGALRDLLAARARFRAGQSFNYDTHGLTMLVDAAYRAGAWDDAAVHADFAVSVAHDAEHLWDYGFVHATAALVPGSRGDWDAATAHLDEAWAWAHGLGIGFAMAMTVRAKVVMLAAREDWAGVLAAVDQVRSFGQTDALGRPGVHDWRPAEVDAHLALGQLDAAGTAVDELERAIPTGGHPTSELAVLRLRGLLAERRGRRADADAAFAAAHRLAISVPTPYAVALLGLADGRRLVERGGMAEARPVLAAARSRLAALGARPDLDRCDALLAAAGASAAEPEVDPSFGLTPTEVVVAGMVAAGGTNQQVAGELFVSVKAVEFHLTNIYGKLGIRSRRELPAAIGASSSARLGR